MTRLEHAAELVGDIRDCANRARDLGFDAAALNAFADELERQARDDRPSLPPPLASNQEARATASERFRKAREILRGIK